MMRKVNIYFIKGRLKEEEDEIRLLKQNYENDFKYLETKLIIS